MNFKLKYVDNFGCSAQRQNILKYILCSFLINVVLKIRQASFAKPEIGLTAILAVSHATGKAVVEGCSDVVPGELYPTCLDFHMPKENCVLVLGLSVLFQALDFLPKQLEG